MARISKTLQKSPTKSRKPGSAGYPCGDVTRERLLETAMRLFGENGYEGASTRDIATQAGTTTPALQYYFENKEGLYLACIERMATFCWYELRVEVAAARAVLAENRPNAAVIDAFVNIQRRLIELMLTSKFAGPSSLIASQQQSGKGPSTVFDMMYEQITVPLFDIHTALIGRLAGRSIGDEQIDLCYLALHGQTIIFLSQRKSTLRRLGWKHYSPAKIALIIETVSRLTRCCLVEMLEQSTHH